MDYCIATEINGYQGGTLEDIATHLDPAGLPRNCYAVVKAAEALIAKEIITYLLDGPPRIWHAVMLTDHIAWKLYRELDRDPLTAEDAKGMNQLLDKLALEPGFDVEPRTDGGLG